MTKEELYRQFILSKQPTRHETGFQVEKLNKALYPHARAVTRWAIRKGRAAIFAGCGLHKTGMQGCWADEISRHEEAPVLIFAPLAVADQTVRDLWRDYKLKVQFCESADDVKDGINVTNYEKLDKFEPSQFCGVVLDESSILKSYTGSFRNEITAWASGLRYRLCCTATPSPNDHVELGTHSEFLGILRREEMLATFFVHDGGRTSDWRLKGHAEDEFWRWVATWALAFRKPSDIGFSDKGFELPPLNVIPLTVESPVLDGYLFPVNASTLSEQREAKRKSIPARVLQCAELVNESRDQWLIFSQLNDESEAITAAIPDCKEITGSDTLDVKRETLLEFLEGFTRVLSTKAKMTGFGINAQCCHNMIVSIDHSHEAFHQIVHRCWRFGQKHPVTVYALFSEAEGAVWENLQRKKRQADEMAEGMIRHMEAEMKRELSDVASVLAPVKTEFVKGPEDQYVLGLGDAVPHMWAVRDETVDYSIFSPPFSSLYTYSALDEDMGNCRTPEQFFAHMGFLVPELFRILKPGRLVSFHCMNLPSSKEKDGVIGLKDFRGDLIRLFLGDDGLELVNAQRILRIRGEIARLENDAKRAMKLEAAANAIAEDLVNHPGTAGFIYHSEVCIWKDPVTAMQRTKALGLLHKQIKKDSAMSRQGIPDYLVTMRKPGKNPEAVAGLLDYFAGDTWQDDQEFAQACRTAYEERGQMGGTMTFEEFRSIFVWQRYASPVWMDIRPNDTLQFTSAREHKDERHICPLQMQVIERGVQLWSNPGDVVFSPFGGIGSEGFQALRMGRRFLGFELKESYYRQAARNLEYALKNADAQAGLFATEAPETTD